MKRKIDKLFMLTGVALLLASCTPFDNYDAPGSTITGRVIDKTTGENLITSQGEFEVRFWETSWTASATPQTQSIPIKQDGTFMDTKLFNATYSMQAYDGPFWPVDSVHNLVLKGSLTQDFEVTPYLSLTDIEGRIVNDSLYMSFKLDAPIKEGFDIREMRPFISWTPFCGGGANIGELAKTEYTLTVNRRWTDMVKDYQAESGTTQWRPAGNKPGTNGQWERNIIDENPNDAADVNYWTFDRATGRFEVGPIGLIANSGFPYRARVGASNNQLGRKTNYSKIIEFRYNDNGSWSTPTVVK